MAGRAHLNTEGAVTIWGHRVGPVVLMWCSACGPMGVSIGDEGAMMVGREHLNEHARGER